jgi:hypothetical protein
MRMITSLLILIGAFIASGTAYAGNESAVEVAEVVVEVNKISIIINGIIRIVAIIAGAFVVWLGHNTMIRGVKGEFEFEGSFGKLKGSVPGLLFVLLGSLAIGWALKTPATGNLGVEVQQTENQTVDENRPTPGSTIPPAKTGKGVKRPSDISPWFLDKQ